MLAKLTIISLLISAAVFAQCPNMCGADSSCWMCHFPCYNYDFGDGGPGLCTNCGACGGGGCGACGTPYPSMDMAMHKAGRFTFASLVSKPAYRPTGLTDLGVLSRLATILDLTPKLKSNSLKSGAASYIDLAGHQEAMLAAVSVGRSKCPKIDISRVKLALAKGR